MAERKSTDAHLRAVNEYNKKIKRKSLNLHIENDADILDHLDTIGNYNDYIKSLIRADMASHTIRVRPGSTFTDDEQWTVVRISGDDAMIESASGKRVAMKIRDIENLMQRSR